jgi:hypothetical protein
LKKNGFTDQTGQQHRYHLTHYGPGQNHPEYTRIQAQSNTNPPLPAGSTTRAVLSESTNLRSPIRLDPSQWALNVTRRNNWNDDNDLSDPNRDPSGTLSRHSSVDFGYPFPDQDFDEPNPPPGSPHPIPRVPLQPRALSPTPPPGDLDPDELSLLELAEFAQVSKSLPSTAVPSAFNESAPVRLIYLHAVKNNIFHNHTEDDCTRQALDVLEVAGLLPLYPIPARTLVTAKRRLGIDVDQYIIKQPICTVCFKNYSAEEIEALENENCTVRRCKGIVYHTKRTAGPANTEATTKRVPAKIQPYAPWDLTIRRMFIRPDFVAALRNPELDANRAEQEDDNLMFDIHDGRTRREGEVGLRRVFPLNGLPYDEEVRPGARRKLMTYKWGLQVTINLDWYVP